MIVSINQPCYLGWLGYFDRIRRSDIHIVLDHVQFEKGSYTNRCRIRQRDGREMWLTVPVEKGKPITQTRIAGTAWQQKHVTALEQAYGHGPHFLLDEFHWLSTLCEDTTSYLAPLLLGRVPNVVRSSDMDASGHKSHLVLNLCKEAGATKYLSGPHGRNYLDIPAFEKAGVEVLYLDFPTDGDWGLSAVHHLSRSFVWPQVDPISHLSSQGSEQAAAAPLQEARLPT